MEVLAKDLAIVPEQRRGARADQALGSGDSSDGRCVVAKQRGDERQLRTNLRHDGRSHDHGCPTRDPARSTRLVPQGFVAVCERLSATRVEKPPAFTLNDGERDITAPADDEVPYAFASVQCPERAPTSEADRRHGACNHERKRPSPIGDDADSARDEDGDYRRELRYGHRVPIERLDQRIVSPKQTLGERNLVQQARNERGNMHGHSADQTSRLT